MSEPSVPAGAAESRRKGNGLIENAFRLILVLAVIAGLAYLAEVAKSTISANSDRRAAESDLVHATGLVDLPPHRLAATFTDSQNRLVADPPASVGQFVDPPTLVMAHIQDTGDEAAYFPWTQFESHLGDVTGRKVRDVVYENSTKQFDKISSGEITVVALHAAETPYLVNNFGYQPAAVLADDSGTAGNKLDIIVPANSPVSDLSGIRGSTLTCTVPSSITGYRTAVVLLMLNQNLRPDVDYFITWSMGQTRSIKGIADGRYTAAAVSDDKLKSMTKDGTISSSGYKVLYQSDIIPRLTVGWFYNLKPELAAKVRDAIISFKPDMTAQAPDVDSSITSMHFVSIDYKKDFELVRQIDDRFEPRFGGKIKDTSASASSSIAGQ